VPDQKVPEPVSRVETVRCPEHVGVVDLPDCKRCVDGIAMDLLLELFGDAGLPLPELRWHTEPADR
jgi:hypothetical protein